jgi:HK97 family phage portal protein
MGIIQSIFKGSSVRKGVTVAPASVLNAPSGFDDYGLTVNHESAFRLTAFNAGIRIISENIASLPKSVKKDTGRGLVNYNTHPAYGLIKHQPNQYTNSFNFWKTIVTWIKGWGNAYVLIRRDSSGMPIGLHQLHPTWVNVKIVAGKKWYQVTCPDPERSFLSGVYNDTDICHFFELSFDGIKGVNPIIYNAIALRKSLATENFSAKYYKKGGNLKAVMETDGNLSDDEYDKFLVHFNKSQDFDTPLLEYGIKYKQLAINPVAAQLIQSEVLSIDDICRILNIPPHMLSELSHATFSNIEQQTIQFVQYSLRPIVKNIEQELETKLFLESENELSIKFVLDGLLRGDTQARSSYYHNAILDGYMSRNEVRAMEGMEYKEGLDDMLYPLNTGIVGKENQ